MSGAAPVPACPTLRERRGDDVAPWRPTPPPFFLAPHHGHHRSATGSWAAGTVTGPGALSAHRRYRDRAQQVFLGSEDLHDAHKAERAGVLNNKPFHRGS